MAEMLVSVTRAPSTLALFTLCRLNIDLTSDQKLATDPRDEDPSTKIFGIAYAADKTELFDRRNLSFM